MAYSIAQGARLPPMRIQIARTPAPVGDVIQPGDLIQLRWRRPDGTSSLVSLAVEDAATGVVVRDWAAGDTALPGTHRGQVVLTGAGGLTEVFPDGTDGGPTWIEWAVTRSL